LECIRFLSSGKTSESVPFVATVDDINELPVLIRQNFLYEVHIEPPSEAGRCNMLKHMTSCVSLHPVIFHGVLLNIFQNITENILGG